MINKDNNKNNDSNRKNRVNNQPERLYNDSHQSKNQNAKITFSLSIFQFVSSVLFGLILFILYLNFRGEFVIIAENLWIFLIFGSLLIISAVFNLWVTIKEKRTGSDATFLSKRVLNTTIWLISWSIWNTIIGLILIVAFFALIVLIADMLAMLGLLLIVGVLIAIPFFGYSGLLLYSSVRVFYYKFKRRENAQILRGMTAVGVSFLFLLSSFLIIYLSYNPQWSEGVDHQPIFTAGEQEGRGYRIPAMLALPNDTVLAFCESREDALLDWGDIDLVMKRSTDEGKTWTDIEILVDEGDNTAGNPCPVYDEPNNVVWLPFCVNNKKVYVMNSSDLGKTWSEPREITDQLDLELSGSDDPLVMEYGTGPGCGIQLSSGRICIPSYYFDERGSHIVYSDDNGTTWKRGESLEEGGECQAFETVDGKLCLNCRTTQGYRYVAWSEDGGETWEEGDFDEELPSPGVMTSIHRYTTKTADSKNRVLYSGTGPTSRGHLTLRMSTDEAESWEYKREIYSGPSAYSQIVILSDLTICILFETGRHDYREQISLVKVDLDWIQDSEGGPMISAGFIFLSIICFSIASLIAHLLRDKQI